MSDHQFPGWKDVSAKEKCLLHAKTFETLLDLVLEGHEITIMPGGKVQPPYIIVDKHMSIAVGKLTECIHRARQEYPK